MDETPDPADEFVPFSCPKCGCAMQALASHAGRKTKCPGCGEIVVIAGGNGGDRGRSRTMPLLLGAIAVLAAVAVGLAVWQFTQGRTDRGGTEADFKEPPPAPEIDDFALLLPDAQMLGSARAADLLARPAVKESLEGAGPLEDLRKDSGIDPATVERAHLVVIDQEQALSYIVARTKKPLDRKAVLEKLPKRLKATHKGKEYFKEKQADKVAAVWIASASVAVAGTEASVKAAIEQLDAPKADGPLAEVVKTIKGGKHHGAFGLVPSEKVIPKGTNAIAEGALKVFRQPKTITATLDAGEKAVVELRFELKDEKAAKRYAADLAAKLQLIRAVVNIGPPASPVPEELAPHVVKCLDALKIEPKGANVIARAEVDEATAIAAVKGLLVQQKK